MAKKKTRLISFSSPRGKVRPLVKPMRPDGRLHWRKQKTLAMLKNRRDWNLEFLPSFTSAYEIEMEHLSDYFLVTEASIPASPIYIITE